MDFVTAWKLTSILLTGAFGILGLFREFKNKETGRITKSGVVSLAGILLSSTLGIVAQFKEASDQQQARDATAKQTLVLAQNTGQAVRDIQRVLYPLDELKFDSRFNVPCSDPRFQAFCLAVNRSRPLDDASPLVWDKWPGGVARLTLQLAFFVDANDAKLFLEGSSIRELANLWISFDATAKGQSLSAYRLLDGRGIQVRMHGSPLPFEIHSDGTIKSSLDLPGTTMFVTTPLNELQLDSSGFVIELKGGEEIPLNPEVFEKFTVHGRTVNRYVFPR